MQAEQALQAEQACKHCAVQYESSLALPLPDALHSRHWQGTDLTRSD